MDLPINSNQQGGRKSGKTATKKRQRESSVSSQRDEDSVLADQEDDFDDAPSNQKADPNHQEADGTPRSPEESYDAPSSQEEGPNPRIARNIRKKRGANRETITLGGIKKIEKATLRKERQKLNRKLGSLNIPTTREKRRGPQPPTISVCFLDNTANGILAKRMQEGEDVVGFKTNYRVKMTESAGTPLGLLLTTNNPWGNKDCERADCHPCSQMDEKRVNCKQRNILYESYCTECNPDDIKQGKKDEITFLREGKGVYVGESARSLYERSKEHIADRESKKEDSHQIKHWILSHPEMQEPPAFRFKIIKTFKDPMSRQLSEAVRIELRGSDILNSKGEYNRCRVPRLRVDMTEWQQKQQQKCPPKEPSNQRDNSDLESEFENSLEQRDDHKRKKREHEEEKVARKPKRIRLDILEGWGEKTNN